VKRWQKNGFLLVAALCLVCGMLVMSGCGSSSPDASSTAEPAGAHAKLVLDTKSSVYPFLVLSNSGDTTAEDVHVYEAKTGTELTTRMVLAKGSPSPASKNMDIAALDGAQLQVNDKDMRDYVVKWSEAGHAFSKQLVLPDPQKIETH
jgi:hypothetical protein